MRKDKEPIPSSKAPFPSYLYLPGLKSPNLTIFDYLIDRFPQIGAKIWEKRILNGDVFFDKGERIDLSTPYCSHKKLCYFREVSAEPEIPFSEKVIFRNEHFLIACKPHYLPVTPSGEYVNNCLLYRLRKTTGINDLVAVHRLDRETAGLVLFSCLKKSRAAYSEMFRIRSVTKQYEAIGYSPYKKDREYWSVENRIVRGVPWFVSQIKRGKANAISEITLVESRGKLSYYHLTPHTGKKHQLRIHLALIAKGIVNDPLYPKIAPKNCQVNFSKPLRLIAKRLEFTDPVTGKLMRFKSDRELNWNCTDG